MSTQAKRIQAMKRNPRDVRPEDLETVLLAAGFTKRKGKGDHRFFFKGTARMTLDFGRSPAHPKTVEDVLVAIGEA